MPSRHRSSSPDASDLEIDPLPPTINPYETLDLEPTATQSEIKSAYRRAALNHHPDKVSPSEKEAAHTHFQHIALAYAILSDERRRARYDATGSTEETLDGEGEDSDFDWISYYRAQYKDIITEDSISQFADTYRGSEEERQAILDAYEQYQGRMERIYQAVMLSDAAEDEERFRRIIDKAIESGGAEAHAKYTDESEKKRAARVAQAKKRKVKEAKEAAKLKDELDSAGKNSGSKGKTKKQIPPPDAESSLAALIQQRRDGRVGDFLAKLEAKYASEASGVSGAGSSTAKKCGKGKKRTMEEPPEEAFARTEARRKT
jgi:DnaJ family protein C protein 9